MRRLTALALLALVGLTGCGPTEGTVVEKTHIPDLSYWTVMPITTCTGSGQCTTRMQPHWVYNPECYRLKLRTPEDTIKDTCVKFAVYQAIREGDYWRKP